MKRFTLRIGAIALGAVLFHCQPVLADCAELCNGNQCNPAPNFPRWGCGISGPVCFDFDCGPFDRGLMEKIEKAVAAGDQNLISLLAASAGQPIRVHDKNGLVYDGFALAGLEGPGAANRSSERLAACQSKSAAATSEEAATAAAVPADDAAATAAQDRQETGFSPAGSANLLNGTFTPAAPTRVWTSDLTFIDTAEGWRDSFL